METIALPSPITTGVAAASQATLQVQQTSPLAQAVALASQAATVVVLVSHIDLE